jgi:glycine hydroxymethyltransferase
MSWSKLHRAKKLFGASQCAATFWFSGYSSFLCLLEAGDKILGFDLSHGGHLTHGSPVNFSGRLYTPSFYGVERETGRLDYDKIQEIALNNENHCRSFGIFA